MMKCPRCGQELRRSQRDPSFGLCDNCRKKFKLIPDEKSADTDEGFGNFEDRDRESPHCFHCEKANSSAHDYGGAGKEEEEKGRLPSYRPDRPCDLFPAALVKAIRNPTDDSASVSTYLLCKSLPVGYIFSNPWIQSDFRK